MKLFYSAIKLHPRCLSDDVSVVLQPITLINCLPGTLVAGMAIQTNLCNKPTPCMAHPLGQA